MFAIYFKKFIRNTWKNRQIVMINVCCLAVGFAAFIILMRYVNYEMTWDKTNPNHSRIYRVNRIANYQSYSEEFTGNYYPLAGALKNELPEIAETVILRHTRESLSTDGINVVYEKNGFKASSRVFEIFPYKIIDGEQNSMLSRPNSIVLSKSLAEKLFPDDNPVGKTLMNEKKGVYTITGIIEDVPENMHFKPSYLISAITEEERLGLASNWNEHANYYVYILLNHDLPVEPLEEKINNIYWKHRDKELGSLYLQPLVKLHLEPTRSRADERYVPIYYSLLAILILVLASVNFMNLFNVASSARSKEIGIMKINGSSRARLIMQFLGEGAFFSVVAFVFAMGIVSAFLPLFNQIIDRSISLDFWNNLPFYAMICGMVLVTGILAGAYPAFALSSFKPVKILKPGADKLNNNRLLGRKSLVVFQFMLAITLISVSFWIYNQVDFMKTKSLGFDPENIVLCRIPSNKSSILYDDLKDKLLQSSSIVGVSRSLNTPLHSTWTSEIHGEGADDIRGIFTCINGVSYDFIDTYQMKLMFGENFPRDIDAGKEHCIINETCAKAFGWDNPIGKTIYGFDRRFRVIGVVQDFHQNSVHDPIIPYFMYLNDEGVGPTSEWSIKIAGNRGDAIAAINTTLQSEFSDVLYTIGGFSETINDVGMQIWTGVGKTFLFFTFVAVAIALFGLFSLVAYSTRRRTKEIGIRKVQGSSTSEIFIMINKEFMVLIAIAILIGLPLANIIISVTPGAYKYQTVWTDYGLIIGAVFSLAIMTAGSMSLKAATRNPVEALRYE